MKQGLTPSDIRINNKLILINQLRVKPCTYIELAKKAKLSTTAINNIACELIEKKLIHIIGNKPTSSAGRRANIVDINKNFGIVILISLNSDLNNNFFSIHICNLKEEILFTKKIPSIIGDTTKLNNLLMTTIEELLNNNSLQDKKLLNISIAAPGMVDDETGTLIVTCLKKDLDQYNIIESLENKFKVPIFVRGLLALMAQAELKKGYLTNACKFGVIFNIEDGIGMSYIINNKSFSGAHGFAGEIGLVKNELTSGYYDTLLQRQANGLGAEISIAVLKNNIIKKLNISDDTPFSNNDILKLYDEKNQIVIAEIINHAHKVASVVKNISILLDPDYFVIYGFVSYFEDFYLDIVKNALIGQFQNKTKIVFSKLKNAVYDGLLENSISEAIKAEIKPI